MKYKFKIKDMVWVPGNKRPMDYSLNKFDDDYDSLFMIISYVETCPFIKDWYKRYYLKHGYVYVAGYFDREGRLASPYVFKESDLKRYYGHYWDVEIKIVLDEFENEFNKMAKYPGVSFWKE